MRLFRKSEPPLVVASFKLTEHCFCGANFAVDVPTYYKDGEVTFALEFNDQIEYWHQNHYHQVNPQMAVPVDFSSTEAVSTEPLTTGIGFRTPSH